MIESVWTQRSGGKTTLPSLVHKSNEWYTPPSLIGLAKTLMGGIELDPASCTRANQLVQAERYYDLQMDGLSQPWSARSIWLNPPYGRTGKNESSQEIWSFKLIAEYECGNVQQAILLANAVTETGWFQRLWSYPICFLRRRVKFYTPNSRVGGPTCGSVLVYFGLQQDRFRELFQPLGQVILSTQVSDAYWWREER